MRVSLAYAGPAHRGARRSAGLGVFGSRRHRFWFGVIGLLALSLPYGSLLFAAIKSVVDLRERLRLVSSLR